MVYLFLGDGFEEAEAICTADVLRRCGAELKLVSVMDRLDVKGAHGIIVTADVTANDITDDGEMYILPGGMGGVENLTKCEKLCNILKSTDSRIAAICAAPTLLEKLGLLRNKKAICYPSLTDELTDATVTNERVVTDGRITTSMGPGTSFDFGFELAGLLKGKEVAENVKKAMLVK